MISRSSSSKARRKVDPFDLSRRRVVESMHSIDVMDASRPVHQLEARTEVPKKRRLRRSRWGLRVLRVAAVAVSLVSMTAFGHWAYQRAFIDNPDFCLKKVELDIPAGFSETMVLEVAELQQGISMMTIDLEAMRTRLANIPLVNQVEVSREFPDKLIISMSEVRPVAWLYCEARGINPLNVENGWLIDEKGVLVKCEEVKACFANLPVIRVADVDVSEFGATVECEVVKVALRLMEASRNSLKGEGLEIVEVVVQNSYSLRARYNNRMQVLFGLTELQAALEDLDTILERTRADGKLLATVNLRVRKNIPVTFYEPPVARPISLEIEEGESEEKNMSKSPVRKG